MLSFPDRRPAGTPDRSTDFAVAVRQGDPGAMEVLRERVRRILRFRRLQIPVHELEDLEQDVMTQVWHALNRPSFDLAGGVWGFVEVVTARRCIDWLRARRLPVALDDSLADSNRDPLGEALEQESSRMAAAALASLDAPCRALIQLRIEKRLSFKELSLRLGKSEEALRVQMHRCVRGARKLLEQHGLAPGSAKGSSP